MTTVCLGFCINPFSMSFGLCISRSICLIFNSQMSACLSPHICLIHFWSLYLQLYLSQSQCLRHHIYLPLFWSLSFLPFLSAKNLSYFSVYCTYIYLLFPSKTASLLENMRLSHLKNFICIFSFFNFPSWNIFAYFLRVCKKLIHRLSIMPLHCFKNSLNPRLQK